MKDVPVRDRTMTQFCLIVIKIDFPRLPASFSESAYTNFIKNMTLKLFIIFLGVDISIKIDQHGVFRI